MKNPSRGSQVLGKLPFKNYFLDYQNFRSNPLQYAEKGYWDHGEFFRFNLLHQPVAMTSSPLMAEQILVSGEGAFGRYTRNLKPVVGNAMITSEGEVWKQKRRLSQPSFHPRAIGRSRELMARQIEDACQEWAQGQDGEPWAVNRLMQRLTLAVVAKVFLKKDIWTLDPRVIGAIDNLYDLAKARITKPVTLPDWVPTPDNNQFKRELGKR